MAGLIRNAAAVLALVMSTSVIAQKAPPEAQRSPDPNEVICERQDVVGSRLQKRRVCMTRSQWAEHRLQDKQAIERVQIPQGLKGQ